MQYELPRVSSACSRIPLLIKLGMSRIGMSAIDYLWILAIICRCAYNIVSLDDTTMLHKYCRDKERLITSEENDEYLLVSAELGSIILLECQLCNEKREQQAKIWYYQDSFQTQLEKEVELGMDNNISYNRIYTTPELGLVIKEFEVSDAGIYRCRGEEGQEAENKYNYRLEPIFKEYDDSTIETGNETDYLKYSEMYLESVTTRFAVSQMTDLVAIRENGITLEVRSEWGAWGPCENCVRNRGSRVRRGYCRLKRYINTEIASRKNSSILDLFRKSPSLPCKSIVLQEAFPTVSNAVRHLPEFDLKETCRKCSKRKKTSKKFKYVKRYVLAEGTHIAVTCPESNAESYIIWKRDSITLHEGIDWSTSKKKDAVVRVIVDMFGTLYLTDISTDEAGNYTCYVDKVNMMQLKIIVVSKTKLMTREFIRSLGYMGFILLLCLCCYCSGLIITCARKQTFKTVDENINTIQKEESFPLID